MTSHRSSPIPYLLLLLGLTLGANALNFHFKRQQTSGNTVRILLKEPSLRIDPAEGNRQTDFFGFSQPPNINAGTQTPTK